MIEIDNRRQLLIIHDLVYKIVFLYNVFLNLNLQSVCS